MATKKKPTTSSSTPSKETPQQIQNPLIVNAQYIKDLSFEHPNPLKTLESKTQPEINIHVDVGAENIKELTYEVTLTIHAEATHDKNVMFMVELKYAGLFTIAKEVPKEAIHPLLMIECPRLLFPFARALIATITREGGFPPLSLATIDFASFYRQQAAKLAQQKQA